jgi:uncharacterized SAM-binding protein YcdF (DUF218 family)
MTATRFLAKTLWDYHHLNHGLRPADFIFVMCSYNLAVADRAATLFQDGIGKFIVASGGIAHKGDLVETPWDKPEAVVFAKRLVELGVSQQKIIIEDKATNSGENVQFTKTVLKEKDINVSSGLIVQKPYMERRAFATCEKQWPEVRWQVTSPSISYEDYIKDNDEERLIHIIVGDTQRIEAYAKKGFQTPQEMPNEVKKALEELLNRGYNQHRIRKD